MPLGKLQPASVDATVQVSNSESLWNTFTVTDMTLGQGRWNPVARRPRLVISEVGQVQIYLSVAQGQLNFSKLLFIIC